MHSAILSSLTLLDCPHLLDIHDPDAALFGKTPNVRLWEHILHHVVVSLDPPSAKHFTNCYPSASGPQAKEFRLIVYKSLDTIRKTVPTQFPALASLTFRKSDLDNIRSDRFERLVLSAISDLLYRTVGREVVSPIDASTAPPLIYTPPPTLPIDLQLKLMRAQALLQIGDILESIVDMDKNQRCWKHLADKLCTQAEVLQEKLNQICAEKDHSNSGAISFEVEQLSQLHSNLSLDTLQTATELLSWMESVYQPITSNLLKQSILESLDHDQLRLHPSKDLAIEIQSLSQQRQFQLFSPTGELDLVAMIETWMGLYGNADVENSIMW
ncbi:hypothetical protein BASA50_003657 [Batrachochytrium salamandrivorans]|uniref:HAUS augmin-like complex subunit 6 N-terminal domain-containing protein n=1 Tax=Batrachochytrium salamandrivorans TaxID=1357716 RepID=A0ABQ8FI28_9FUNG|nr:hypothetical protein BASA50_003657 [Batrachochytrium salamandrivorans]KAH6600797.1 hypothetical protein BASA61_002215 [Batrachochytrium salamandrivorans]KAH9266764.1 hypothetical protein BASA84_001018 [Batrachochytrium salamandrivorans]